MGDLNTVRCDVCQAEKREVNRWWILWVNAKGQLNAAQFEAGLWERLKRSGRKRAVVCGEEHAQVIFSRWMRSGKFEREVEPDGQAKN